MKKSRIIIGTKVSTSNRVRAGILFQAEYKPRRIFKLNFFSHETRLIA